MQFNQSIGLLSRPKYAEGTPLSSSRDDRNNSFLWKKGELTDGQTDSLRQAIQKLSREVAKQRRKPLGGYIPTPQNVEMFPFKIYNIQNVSATDAQKKLFTDQGLDINDFTFQLRSGIVGVRSNFTPPASESWALHLAGNYEQEINCPGTDFIGLPDSYTSFDDQPEPNKNGFGCLIFNNGDPSGSVPSLIYNGLDGSTAYDQICVAPQIDFYGNSLGAAWLEIIDDPVNGIYVNVWGKQWTTDTAFDSYSYPFPLGSNIIPIAFFGNHRPVGSDPSPAAVFTNQYQWGNLVNRYVGNQSNWRGYWTAGALTGKIFYNGDLVLDDTNKIQQSYPVSGGSGNVDVAYYGIYQYINGVGEESEAPNLNPSKWTIVGTQLCPP